MARLVLVGLPGVGKSSVARAVGARWGCESLDTDELIESNVGEPAASYLRREGESTFRTRELEVLVLAVARDAVVATGGGVVCTREARELLAGEVTLWLDSDDDVILERLDHLDRPLLGERPATALTGLRAAREGWYREVSRLRVDATGTLDDVVRRVVNEVARVAP